MKEKITAFFRSYGYIFSVLFVLLYFLCFMIAEKIVTPEVDYWVSYLPLDDKIPFLEIFAIPYVLWYPFMLAIGVHLAACDPEGYRRYVLMICLTFYSFLAFSLLFPNGQNLRADLDSLGRDNFCIDIMRALYSADTNTNVLPSMHAVGTFTTVLATFGAKTVKNIPFKVFTAVMGILISVSIVFVKQHSILDLYTAVPYTAVFYVISYKLVKFKKTYSAPYKAKKKELASTL